MAAAKINKIERRVLDYLKKNPDAGDTLEGMAHWWIQSERIGQSLDVLAAVLVRLVQKKLIVKLEAHGGSPLYKYRI